MAAISVAMAGSATAAKMNRGRRRELGGPIERLPDMRRVMKDLACLIRRGVRCRTILDKMQSTVDGNVIQSDDFAAGPCHTQRQAL